MHIRHINYVKKGDSSECEGMLHMNRKQIAQRQKDKKVKTYFCLETKEWRTFFPRHSNASIKACREQGYNECNEMCLHFLSDGCDRPATPKEIERQLNAIKSHIKKKGNEDGF